MIDATGTNAAIIKRLVEDLAAVRQAEAEGRARGRGELYCYALRGEQRAYLRMLEYVQEVTR